MNKTGYAFLQMLICISLIFYPFINIVVSVVLFQIDDAVKVYEQTETFGFMHCWKILRNEAKWNDRLLELNNTPPSVNAQANCRPMQGETENDNGAPARPEGRDSAKKSRSKGIFEGSSSSTAVEVLQ